MEGEREREKGRCVMVLWCESAAKSAAALRFCVHRCREVDGEREKFILRSVLLSQSGRSRRSKRGHGCATRCRESEERVGERI